MNERAQSIPHDLEDLIRWVYPDQVIRFPANIEDSFFWKLHESLAASLNQIPGARLLYQQTHDGEAQSPLIGHVPARAYNDDDDFEPVSNHRAASYHVFFVALSNEDFTYKCDFPIAPDEAPDDIEDASELVSGTGHIGFCAAVSLLAPIARVELRTFEVFENGDVSTPDLDPVLFDTDGSGPADVEQFVEESMGPSTVAALRTLRDAVTAQLHAAHLRVLTTPEATTLVPWLRPDAEVIIGKEYSRPVNIQNAFFFQLI